MAATPTLKLSAADEKVTSAAASVAKLGVVALESAVQEARGDLQLRRIDAAGARASYEGALRAAAHDGDDEAEARLLSKLISVVGWQLGRAGEARALVPLAEGVLQRLGDPDRLTGLLLESQGDVEWQDERLEVAVGLYRRALERFLRRPGAESLEAARLHYDIAWSLLEMGNLDEAQKEAEASVGIRQRLLGDTHPALFPNWTELGSLAEERGDPAAAMQWFERAVATLESSIGPKSRPMLIALANLAEAASRAGRAPEGLSAIERARSLLLAMPDAGPVDRAPILRAHAVLLRLGGKRAEAEGEARQALAFARSAYGADHPRLAGYLYELSSCLRELHRDREALELADAALAIMGRVGETHSPTYGSLLELAGRAALALHRGSEAREHLEQATSLFAKAGAGWAAEVGLARQELAQAEALVARGRPNSP